MIKLIKIATVIGILALTLSVASAKAIYVPDNYTKIRWVVDNATDGDTIIDGNVTTTASLIISHVYSAAGTYTVNLTVTDNDGLTNSTSKQISLPVIEENYILRILITTDPCSVEGEDEFVINLSVISREGIIMEEKSYRLYLTSNKQMYSLARPPQDTSPPVITFVDPTPANNSVLDRNYVFVNVTSNESLATALLNWNGVNITMHGHGTNWYFNMTGLSNGAYAFKVYGADQAGNWNMTELRIVSISLPIIEAGYILTLSVISKPCIASGESGYILDLAITSRACRILEEDNYRVYLALQALKAPISKEPLANLPPIAAFTVTPSPAIVNQVVTFNASLSYDSDGSIVSYEWDFGDGNVTNTTEETINHSYSEAGNYEVTLTVTDDNEVTNSTTKIITIYSPTAIFDTGTPLNPYPSIAGTHNGTITTNQTIIVTKLYTYPCAGTGGHTEYARIWNKTWNATATWEGYASEWHNITFDKTVVLLPNKTYNYTIRTGSYPQIHHTDALPTKNGWINCTKFTDANGEVYYDWIPAIKLS